MTFVGENGAGKSTLFDILNGIVQPDQGGMWLDGLPFWPGGYGQTAARGVVRVFEEQALAQNVLVYENLPLSREHHFTRLGQLGDRRAMIRAARRMVEEAGARHRRHPANRRLRLLQAAVDRDRPRPSRPLHLAGIARPLILLDEPISAFDRRDEEAFFRLVERLKRQGSLLLVSHRLSGQTRPADGIATSRSWPSSADAR